LQTVVAKDPKNVQALMELGAIYHYEDRAYKKAEALYRQALALSRIMAAPIRRLGDLTYWVHNNSAGAETLYRRAIAAEPNNGYFHANLGRMLALTGKQAQGVAAANQAKALGFNDDHPVWAATGVNP
jgi:Flp pilus assembly protein TadD